MIYENLIDLIGKTPVVKFDGIYIKLESYNITGSVKDRAAKFMIEALEKEGKLKKGSTIVEPTSGNTGISLAMIGALKGYNVVLVMPDTMSVERQQIMKAYGAKIVLTDGKKGMNGSIEEAKRLVDELGYVMPMQFDNYDNVVAHEKTTAIEIMNDFDHLDYVVIGIGTGGTISGIAKVIKTKFPHVKIIGVEPEESPILTKGIKGPHGIQGIGAGFVPSILDLNLIDEIRTIKTSQAQNEANQLAKKGLLLGVSSAASVLAAKHIKNESSNDLVILSIAPDNGFKYLSLNIY